MAIEHSSQHSPDLKGKTITIGAGAPLSGRAAALGREMSQAIRVAVDECNEGGGIFGATVELSSTDDAGRVDAGEAAARGIFAKTNLLGVVGHYNSDVTLATSLIYDAANVTMITPIVSNPKLTERNLANVFRFTNRDDETGIAIARYLRNEMSKHRAVIVGTTTTYGHSMSAEFKASFEKLGGQVVDQVWVDEGTEDFEVIVDRMPKDFDLVFYGGTFEGAPLLRSLRNSGRNELFATGDGCWDSTNFLEPAGSAVCEGEGILVLSATPQLGRVPGSLAFAERYMGRYGGVGNYAVNSYDATKVLLAAISSAARMSNAVPARESIAGTLRDQSFQGIAYPDPVSWKDDGDNISAVTALYVAGSDGFKQVAQIPRSDAQ